MTATACAGGPGAAQPTDIMDVETPVGPARAHRWAAGPARRGRIVLGHGAGGRSWSADLLAMTVLAADGWDVVLVEQPWRVAGRKVAGPPAQLDAAWTAVVSQLAREQPAGDRGGALVLGGRSAGARVACRTAAGLRADAVLALAFPLHPPGRADRTRAAELAGVASLPVLLVQGRRDPFGRPEEFEAAGLAAGSCRLAAVTGGHGFGPDLAEVVDQVRAWLSQV